MCQQLTPLRQALSDYTATFDARLLDGADARRLLADATAIEHLAATLKALTAARIADCGTDTGARSAAHQLAHRTGTTIAAARQSLDIGRSLGAHPDIDAAARRGELSTAQLAAITHAAAANPQAAPQLLHRAATTTLAELQNTCARTKADAQPDPAARHHHIHTQRRLQRWTDTDGVWHLHANGTPEHGAQIDAALTLELAHHHMGWDAGRVKQQLGARAAERDSQDARQR